MTRGGWLWRAILLLAGLALTLPLWIAGGRADPLFLLPLAGAISLALTHPAKPFATWLHTTAQLGGAAMLVMTALVWLASAAFGLGQSGLVIVALLVLGMVHQGIAKLRFRIVRFGLHGLVMLLWLPLGSYIVDSAYRWPVTDDRPTIAVSSSLPLLWGAALGDPLAALRGDAEPAPLYRALGAAVDLRAVDTITLDSLRDARVLLLVQPRAFSPATLVSIDNWVRAGGSVVWLTDPALAAGYEFPLGDPRNPVPVEPNGALFDRARDCRRLPDRQRAGTDHRRCGHGGSCPVAERRYGQRRTSDRVDCGECRMAGPDASALVGRAAELSLGRTTLAATRLHRLVAHMARPVLNMRNKNRNHSSDPYFP